MQNILKPRSSIRGMPLRLAMVLAVVANSAVADTTCPELEALALEVTAARDSNPAEGVARGEKALAAAEVLQSPCPTGKAMLQGGIASNLHILGRNAEAVQHYEKGLETLGEAGTPAQIAFLHRGLGVVLVDMESYQIALRHYLTALASSDAAGERIESAKTAGNIGILYTSIGELQQSRDYHGRSLAGFEAADFKPGIAGALVNLGAVAAKFGQQAIDAGDAAAARREHEMLRDLNERALALFAELGNQRGIAYAASNIGLAFDRLGQPLQALPQHERSLALRREIGDRFGTINSLLSMVVTLRSLERGDEAAEILKEAAALVPADSYNLQREVAEQRVLLAESRSDYRAALVAQRDVTRLGGLIADEGQRSEITALQDRFDADQAGRQIDLLRSEAHIGELKLQRQRLVAGLSMLIAVLLAGLFLVLLSRYRVGARSTRELAVAARTDQLTGLPNRRHLIELMQYEEARVARDGRSFCLLMADLDDFKAVNDRYGHDAGDAVLHEVARRLRDAIRKQDTVARWGGEEFLLLLPDSAAAGAMALANKLRERISSEPFEVGQGRGPVTLTVTLGFSECRPGIALDDCIREADSALYQGKHEGKNRTAAPRRENGSALAI
jgi:diguanylate cyclase (GGDEF)-like protein